MTQAFNLSQFANSVDSSGKASLTTGVTGTLPVANGGSGQTTFTNGQLLIGNTTGNTLTKATLTQGSGITITNGAGAITIAATGGGSVTSVATGNGLSGGTITTSGTLIIACPEFNTVGSYASCQSVAGIFAPGSNYAAGQGDTQLFVINAGNNVISGTWKWMQSQNEGAGLACRVS